MADPAPLSADELEQLVKDLESGRLDDPLQLPKSVEPAGLEKFADVKPFDVRQWAERRNIKLPDS